MVGFVDGFRPIYYFSRVCGQMPFSITYDSVGKPQQPKIGKRDGLWLVLSIVIYLSTLIVFLRNWKMSKDIHTANYILLLCDNLHVATCLVFGIFMIGMDMFNRFKTVEILTMFTIFDKEASNCAYALK